MRTQEGILTHHMPEPPRDTVAANVGREGKGQPDLPTTTFLSLFQSHEIISWKQSTDSLTWWPPAAAGTRKAHRTPLRRRRWAPGRTYPAASSEAFPSPPTGADSACCSTRGWSTWSGKREGHWRRQKWTKGSLYFNCSNPWSGTKWQQSPTVSLLRKGQQQNLKGKK